MRGELKRREGDPVHGTAPVGFDLNQTFELDEKKQLVKYDFHDLRACVPSSPAALSPQYSSDSGFVKANLSLKEGFQGSREKGKSGPPAASLFSACLSERKSLLITLPGMISIRKPPDITHNTLFISLALKGSASNSLLTDFTFYLLWLTFAFFSSLITRLVGKKWTRCCRKGSLDNDGGGAKLMLA